MCFARQWRALFRHLNLQKWREHVVFCTFWLGNVLRATTACTFSTSQLPKVVRESCALYILTWKCASRHNGVHFFDISTSKSGPRMVCFVHFDLEMCFAPQRRALFRHLNFQKWSENRVLCTFWLGNVLRATTACNFSSLISPDVSAPAALASLLFNPPEPQNHEKTQCFATFLPFRAPASSFFWPFLFWLFSLLTAFSSLRIVGSLTSKLPSMLIYVHIYVYMYKGIYVYVYIYVYMYIYIYVCVCIYIYIYVYIYICMCIYMYVYIYICMHIYIYICFYLFVYIYIYVCVCMHVYIYIYLYLYVCIYVYKYICTYIYIYTPCFDHGTRCDM